MSIIIIEKIITSVGSDLSTSQRLDGVIDRADRSLINYKQNGFPLSREWKK